MAFAVPICCGVLVGLCCACVLGCFVPAGAGASSVSTGDLVTLCRALGTWPPVARLAHSSHGRRVMEELGCLRFGAARPLWMYGADVRAGACVLLTLAAVGAGVVVAWSAWGIVAGVLPVAVLNAMGARRARTRARTLETSMPEAFGSLAISLGSGYSLTQAMRFVGARSAEPIRSEFTRVSFAVDCGVPAAQALDAMLERLQAPGLELVVLALKVSKRTGAPLGELLAEASELCHERLELKRMLDVKTSQARMSARLVALMPVAMVMFLTLLSSDFRHGLTTHVGLLSIAVALALNAVAWMVIRKIMDVEV